MAAITFDRKMPHHIAIDHSKRTSQNAAPATDTAFFTDQDKTLLVLVKAIGDTGRNAGCTLTVAAEYRGFYVALLLYKKPALRQTVLADYGGKVFFCRMCDSAGNFAALAA
jgi:hypothetical protein